LVEICVVVPYKCVTFGLDLWLWEIFSYFASILALVSGTAADKFVLPMIHGLIYAHT